MDHKYTTFGDILSEVLDSGYILKFDSFPDRYLLGNPLFVITDSKERMCEYIMERNHELDEDIRANTGELIILVVNKESFGLIKYTNGLSLQDSGFYYIEDNQYTQYDEVYTDDLDENGCTYFDHLENIQPPIPQKLEVVYPEDINFVNCIQKLSKSKNICVDISDSKLLYCVGYVLARCRKSFSFGKRCYTDTMNAFIFALGGLASSRGAYIPEQNERRIKRLSLESIEKLNPNQTKQLTSDFDRNTIELVIRQGKTIDEQEKIFEHIKYAYSQLVNWNEIPYDNETENALDDLYINILAKEFICDNPNDNIETTEKSITNISKNTNIEGNCKLSRKQAIFLLHHSGITKQKKLTQLQYGAVVEMLAGHSHNTVKRDFNKYMKEGDLTLEEATMVTKEFNRLSNDNGKKKSNP